MRTLVIVNPASAGGATARRWDHIAGVIREAIGSYESAFTDAPGHAGLLTTCALEEGYETVVAVGGDGTLNEVVGGFFRGRERIAPNARLGIVPAGTGCDFARALDLEGIEQSSARLGDARSRFVDVGLASFTDPNGVQRTRPFLNVASLGCSGRVARALGRRFTRAGGSLAFVLATIGALLVHRDIPISITFDNTLHHRSITNFAMCNGRYFGGGMQVAPEAVIDDGRFNATVWSGFGLVDFITNSATLYDGTHIHDSRTWQFQARETIVTGPADVPVELDGEYVGSLPLRIEILPGSLRLIA